MDEWDEITCVSVPRRKVARMTLAPRTAFVRDYLEKKRKQRVEGKGSRRIGRARLLTRVKKLLESYPVEYHERLEHALDTIEADYRTRRRKKSPSPR